MNIQEKYKLAYEKIKQAKNILLITHERPDGDALASVCSMSVFLEHINKDFFIYCHDKPSSIFNFLPNVERIKDKKPNNWERFDLIIIMDCGAVSRTKAEEELTSGPAKGYIIELDHHPAVDKYSDLEIRSPKTSSTAELLFNFFRTNGIKIDKDMATGILTGILTDTINFLNPSTTAGTISIASEMLSCGAHMPKINRFAWKNKNIGSMKALGSILDKLKVNKKYNFAFSCLTYEEMQVFKGSEETFDSVMNFLTNMDGVRAIMLLREEKPGKIKGSLRTNYPNVDVSKLAKHLNGGGHAKASGFKVDGHIKKTASSWRIVDG